MKKKTKIWRVLLVVVLILAITVAGVYFYRNRTTEAQAPDEPALQTATVRRGDLVVSATGAGAVIPASQVNLGFSSGGALVELPIKVGDKVNAGAILARVDDTEARRALGNADLGLEQAKLELAKAQEGPTAEELAGAEAALASAQATLDSRLHPATSQEIAAAQQSLVSAQQKLQDLLAGPTDDARTTAEADLRLAQINVQQAQTDYDKVSWRPDVGQTSQAAALEQATLAFDKAKATYDAATKGASAGDVAAARAAVAQAQSQLDTLRQGSTEQEVTAAQASVDQAQAALDSLKQGTSSTDLQLAQIGVKQAESSVASAQTALDNTVLAAPFTGTITALSANLGERVGSSTILTLADIARPLVEVYVDESDLGNVGIDYEAEVTFDALPDQVFPGRVIQVDPQLTNSNGVTAIRAVVQLDPGGFAKPVSLPIGLNASVDVIGGRATQALLVPVEALREISSGKSAVFVMKNGKPTLTMVEVGLKDLTSAEIKSGLNEGDVVTTGIVQTGQGQAGQTQSNQSQGGPPVPGGFGPGG